MRGPGGFLFVAEEGAAAAVAAVIREAIGATVDAA